MASNPTTHNPFVLWWGVATVLVQALAAAYLAAFPYTTSIITLALLPFTAWSLWAIVRSPLSLLQLTPFLLVLSIEDPKAGPFTWFSPLATTLVALIAIRQLSKHPQHLRSIFRHPLTITLILWLLWMVIATLFSANFFQSLETTFRHASLCLGIFLSLLALPPAGRQKWWNMFFAATLLLTLYSLFRTPLWAKASSIPFFPNDNILAALLLALAILYRPASQPTPSRPWAYIPALLMALIAAWKSRGAAVALAVVTWMILPPFRRGLYIRIFLLLIMFLGFFAYRSTTCTPSSPEIPGILGGTHTFSDQERVMRWTLALRIAADHPLTGIGPGCFAPHFSQYLHTKAEKEKISYWHGWRHGAHNQELNTLAELGIPGLLIALTAAILLLYHAYLLATHRKPDLAPLLATLALLTHMQFEDLIYTDTAGAIFPALAAILVAHQLPKNLLPYSKPLA